MNFETHLVEDNLSFLKELKNNYIDLIYVDPPFNSGRLHKDAAGEFSDTWGNANVSNDLLELKREGKKVEKLISFIEEYAPNKTLKNYLAFIAARGLHMHRVLKKTGSFYLHCDDTAGFYIKIVLDCIFGASNFKNAIAWKRTTAKSCASKNYVRSCDYILYYVKSNKCTFNPQYLPLSENGLKKYCHVDDKGRRYNLCNATSPMLGKGEAREWDVEGKKIRYNSAVRDLRWTQETLDRKRKEHFEKYGTELVKISERGVPRIMFYLENSKGKMLDNVWTDIHVLSSTSKERLGYPTQKPQALLERIILASSNPGDLVADFFMGSGTTGAAAVKLGRRFIGCDINPRAVEIAQNRLKKIASI